MDISGCVWIDYDNFLETLNCYSLVLFEGVLYLYFYRERHNGGVASGWKVIHKNNISVDNRLENLCLVPQHCKTPPVSAVEEPSSKFSKDQSLYWIAVQQLHVDPVYQHFHEPLCSRLLDRDGDPVSEEGKYVCSYHIETCLHNW